MLTLQAAYQIWVNSFPKKIVEGARVHVHTEKHIALPIPKNYDGECDCINGAQNHFYEKPNVKTDSKGNPYTEYQTVATPDAKVCARERAWRQYCSVRDNVNYRVL